MTTKETGSESGRDTRMCGDPKTWFPMRVTYQREMKVKAELDSDFRAVDAGTSERVEEDK